MPTRRRCAPPRSVCVSWSTSGSAASAFHSPASTPMGKTPSRTSRPRQGIRSTSVHAPVVRSTEEEKWRTYAAV